jgi:hypothetical protein
LTVNVLLQDIQKLETEALIAGFYEDVRPLKGLAGELDWLLCGALSGLILKNKIRGSLGDVALLTSQGKVPAQKIFMVGLGTRAGFSPRSVRRAASIAAASAVSAGVRRMAMECFFSSGTAGERDLAELHEGLTEGAGAHTLDVTLLAPDAANYEKMVKFAKTWSSGTYQRDPQDVKQAQFR